MTVPRAIRPTTWARAACCASARRRLPADTPCPTGAVQIEQATGPHHGRVATYPTRGLTDIASEGRGSPRAPRSGWIKRRFGSATPAIGPAHRKIGELSVPVISSVPCAVISGTTHVDGGIHALNRIIRLRPIDGDLPGRCIGT